MPPNLTAADSSPSVDTPQVAALRFNRKQQADKLERLKGHKTSEAHDVDAAKIRTERAIKEIDDEIKRLEKK